MNTLLWIMAVGLGVLALLGAAWALFADRSRRRRRCPRCFHAMDPKIGLVCPECGHDARDERRLFHTRRRWKLAIATMVVFGGMSLALSGLARVQQTGGWKACPNWAGVRLLGLHEPGLDKAIGERIASGALTRGECLLVVREARRRLRSEDRARIDSGMALLARVPSDSWAYGRKDIAIARPILEELEPERLFDSLQQLLARESDRATDVFPLMWSIRDADARAVVALVEMMAAADPELQSKAMNSVVRESRPSATRMVRRFPSAPLAALSIQRASFSSNGLDPAKIAGSLAVSVAGFHGDLQAIRIWAENRWKSAVADPDARDAERLPELWLWCRLDGFGPGSWGAVRDACSNDDATVQEYAVYLVSAYDWSHEVEEVLRSKMHSIDRETYVRAFETAAKFGPSAKPLTRDILDLLASLEGARLYIELLRQYRVMGGSDGEFFDAVSRRLDLVLDRHFDEIVFDPGRRTPKQVLYLDSDMCYVAEIRFPDPHVAAQCRRLMNEGPSALSLYAARTYASLSGDKRTTTEFVLRCMDDPRRKNMVQDTTERLWTLVREGLTDLPLVLNYYEHADDARLMALFTLLRNNPRCELIEPFMPIVNRAAKANGKWQLQADAKTVIGHFESITSAKKSADGK